MYTGSSIRTHDSTDSVRCKGLIPTKGKKFFPVYKSWIVKSRKKPGTGAGVRSYRGVNLMRKKAFAESRKGVKKNPPAKPEDFWPSMDTLSGGPLRSGTGLA